MATWASSSSLAKTLRCVGRPPKPASFDLHYIPHTVHRAIEALELFSEGLGDQRAQPAPSGGIMELQQRIGAWIQFLINNVVLLPHSSLTGQGALLWERVVNLIPNIVTKLSTHRQSIVYGLLSSFAPEEMFPLIERAWWLLHEMMHSSSGAWSACLLNIEAGQFGYLIPVASDRDIQTTDMMKLAGYIRNLAQRIRHDEQGPTEMENLVYDIKRISDIVMIRPSSSGGATSHILRAMCDLLRQLLRRPDVEYQLHIRDVLERSAHELETRRPSGSEDEKAGHLS